MNLHELKKQLRSELKQRRTKIPAAERAKMSTQIIKKLQKINAFIEAKRIFCYISYLSEVETGDLIDYFIGQNLMLAVPKITGQTEMIAAPLSDRADLKPDKMGILTPKSNRQMQGPFDVVITPGVGFTQNGGRLGYGRGYYDRWFANNEVKTKIAVTFEAQIVDKIPLEDTDIPLDILVTEQRIIDLRKR